MHGQYKEITDKLEKADGVRITYTAGLERELNELLAPYRNDKVNIKKANESNSARVESGKTKILTGTMLATIAVVAGATAITVLTGGVATPLLVTDFGVIK